MKTIFVLTLIFCSSLSFAAGEATALPGACKQIADACTAAGFIKGDWKKGDGLWRDCVDPIIQGVTSVPGASKPLPIIDAKTISACKAKHPKFGSGKVGS